MASLIYNEALRTIAAAYLNTASDLRCRLCMSNTTCDTENDTITKLVNFTTIDQSDASGYADQPLVTEVVNRDDAADRAEFDAADIVFAGLGGNATRAYQGVLIYKWVDGTAANDIPIAFIDFTADIPAAATQVTVPWNVEGIIQFMQGA